MSLRKQFIRGALTLGTAQALGQVLSFVRNIIIARMLTQADYGIAATFALTVSLLEMSSDLAASKLLVQSKDGDDPKLQGVIHTFEFARGLLLGIMLLAIAGPVAALFDIPEATWAFRLLALSPVLRGLRHLDIQRFQRNMRFGPAALLETGSQAVAVAAAWPLAAWLGDYSAVLYIVLSRDVLLVIVSHLVAERSYRFSWNPEYAKSVFAFGWPLLFNGLLMYAALQGDRLVVGTAYTMTDLGLYAAAATLATTPVIAIAQLHTALALPVLSKAQDDRAAFGRLHTFFTRGLAIVAGGFIAVLVLLHTDILSLVYGEKYAAAGIILAWLGVAQGIRMLRVSVNASALGIGDTKNTLLGNIARAIGLPCAVLAVVLDQPIWMIAAAALVGELAAAVMSSVRLRSQRGVPARTSLMPACALLIFAGFASWLAPEMSLSARIACVGGILLLLGGLACRLILSGTAFVRPEPGGVATG